MDFNKPVDQNRSHAFIDVGLRFHKSGAHRRNKLLLTKMFIHVQYIICCTKGIFSIAGINIVLGLSEEAYQQYQMAENAEQIASFDEVLFDRSASVPGPEELLMVRRSLEQALRGLDEREQRVVQMYYEFELSYKEIAAVLDLTDARVCQLNKAALGKMKAALEHA